MGLRLLLLIAVVGAFSGCGFHLRGAEQSVPGLKQVYLDLSPSSPLYYELESLLLAAGTEVVESRLATELSLVVKRTKISSRTLSLDSQGRASEYGLILVVHYSLQTVDGRIVDEPLSTRVERDYRFDPDNVLAQEAERELVEQEMYRRAAQQMMRRLRRTAISARIFTPPEAATTAPAQ